MISRFWCLAILPLLAGCGSIAAVPPGFGTETGLGYPAVPLPPSARPAATGPAGFPDRAAPEQSSVPLAAMHPTSSAQRLSPASSAYDPAKDLLLTTARVGSMPPDKSSEFDTRVDGKISLPPMPHPKIIQVSEISKALVASTTDGVAETD